MDAAAAELELGYRRDQRRRGLQPTTIERARSAIRSFSKWLGDRPLTVATTADVEDFLDSPGRGGRPRLPKTRYCLTSHLHSFYQWAIHAGHVEIDPTEAIHRPRLPRHLPRPISIADLEVALTVAGPVERAILALGAFAGMRCIEISRLTREDVLDTEDPPVIVAFGKGAKERIIPLHPEAWRALQLLPLPKAGPVFRSADGRPFEALRVSRIGNRLLDSIGSEATMHQLRHFFGTHTYRTSGRDLLLVAELMGHESLASTRIYARYNRAGAREAVEALSASATTPAEAVPTVPPC